MGASEPGLGPGESAQRGGITGPSRVATAALGGRVKGMAVSRTHAPLGPASRKHRQNCLSLDRFASYQRAILGRTYMNRPGPWQGHGRAAGSPVSSASNKGSFVSQLTNPISTRMPGSPRLALVRPSSRSAIFSGAEGGGRNPSSRLTRARPTQGARRRTALSGGRPAPCSRPEGSCSHGDVFPGAPQHRGGRSQGWRVALEALVRNFVERLAGG